jgi:glycerate 2-kinase
VNSDTIISADPRSLLERAFRNAVAAAEPALVMAGSLPGPPRGRLIVVGAGKAAATMSSVVERHYGADVSLLGIVVAPDGHAPGAAGAGRRIEVALASHPVPDERGVRATERILSLVEGAGPDDLVLVLISGGGSALLCAPDGLELAEKSALTRDLLRSGASISEMNTVRKHLSRVKGGRLALAASPAPVTALVLSDVVGDDLSSIASGPTSEDPTTYRDALAVLDRYRLHAPAARLVLEEGARGRRPETPKPGSGSLDQVRNLLLASNQRSLEAAAETLGAAGYTPHVLSSTVTGESREVAGVHAAIVRQVLDRSQPFTPPCALISGGETTVTVRGGGRGGRNGEFGLALALGLPAGAPVWALAADTDGIDGSESNAGVVVTPELLKRLDRPWARALLDANDSYSCFLELDGLLVTGPTGTNVNDLRLVLVGAPNPRAAGVER